MRHMSESAMRHVLGPNGPQDEWLRLFILRWCERALSPECVTDLYELHVERFSRGVEAHIQAAAWFRKMNLSDKSKKLYETALKYEPKNTEALLGISSLLVEYGRHSEALPFLKRLSNLCRDNLECLLLLGHVRLATNEFRKAVDAYSKVLDSYPLDSGARIGRALAYQGLGRVDESIEELSKTLSSDGRNPNASYFLGSIFQDLGQLETAIANLQAAISHADSNWEFWIDAHTRLIECLVAEGAAGQIEQLVHEVLQSSMSDDASMITLAETCFNAGRADIAKLVFNRVLSKSFKNSSIQARVDAIESALDGATPD